MNQFTPIRKAALAKRDAAIKQARDEYAETLKRISALEQDILGRDPSTHRTIASCIEILVPSDRTFTTVDIMAGLEAMDPGKVWRKRSVDSHIARLREKEIVRRVRRKSKGTEPAVYARVGVEVETVPFMDIDLAGVVAVMLEGRSLTQTELVVHMLESGYETSMGKKALRNAVGRVLKGDLGRFRREGSRWRLADDRINVR